MMSSAEAPRRALIMGVLNVTPDSFSDGGQWLDPAAAVARGREMAAQGADIIDVGGESTRPGAEPVAPEDQLRRIVPVIEALAQEVRVSVDTRSAEVADVSLGAGATLLNDVSASLHEVAAAHQAGWVAMHMQGEPGTMQRDPSYADVVSEVSDFLLDRAEQGRRSGVSEVWVDPGIGFGKTAGHNLELLRGIGSLVEQGNPVMVGASRKGFLGALTSTGGVTPEPADRVEASVAIAVWCALQGVGMVRVHDVAETAQAMRLVGDPIETAVA